MIELLNALVETGVVLNPEPDETVEMLKIVIKGNLPIPDQMIVGLINNVIEPEFCKSVEIITILLESCKWDRVLTKHLSKGLLIRGAVQANRSDLMKRVDKKDPQYVTDAAIANTPNRIKLLVNKGFAMSPSAVDEAVNCGNVEALKMLVQLGATLESHHIEDAVKYGNLSCTRYLHSVNSPINLTNLTNLLREIYPTITIL